MENLNKDDIILKVDNLSQYFKMGTSQLKAVDHVSFDVRKGEVFGLVGESGCGKTTTGRTIIKLYNATGGNVYFKNTRIVAGTMDLKASIKQAKVKLAEDLKKINAEKKEALVGIDPKDARYNEIVSNYNAKANEIKSPVAAYIAQQRKEIKAAIYDHRNCDKDYAAGKANEVKEKYSELIAKASTEAEKDELNKAYKEDLKIAKKTRLITQIQMIFQDPIASLNPRMTVREIIGEGLIIKGIRSKEYINSEVLKSLDMVGLVPEHATRYPHEFSGGQRQRIGVARSIIMKPDLIIADEPISALDVSIQAQVINLLNDLRKELGLTILFIAHDLSVVKYFSDKIAVMYYGKIVELSDSDKLFEHPLHPYTKSLLSAIPLPDPVYESKRKRITYNPVRDHDYSVNKPTMREIVPGHFILCNDEEFERYLKEING